MKNYFILQFKRINRTFTDDGYPPLLVYPILLLLFVFGSKFLFEKSSYSTVIFLIIPIIFLFKLSDIQRLEFLKFTFNNNDFYKIRITENILLTIPFIIILIHQKLYFETGILLFFSVFFTFLNFKISSKFTIPTPFGKTPFEFLVGFRTTYLIFPFSYFLAIVAVLYNNSNLGVFSILLLFITFLTYYTKVEQEYFVWNFSLTSNEFLLNKIKTAILQSSLLIIPNIIFQFLFFYNDITSLILFLIIGYGFLIYIILAKYTVYPDEIGLAQGVLMAISVYFPPLLVIIIPYLYKQSIKNLNIYLK